MDDVVREIEKVAYQLWEKEGRPSGREKENWYQAEIIVGARLKEGAELFAECQAACTDEG